MATLAETKTGDGFSANLSLGTCVLVFAYVAIAVLKQSDAELILPSSTFDLGGLLDKFKDGIPGGAFVAPVLQIKLPLYMFYTLGPLLLLALHAVIVFRPKLLSDAAPPLRFAAIWLPPLTIALIIWRFSSYVAARPEPSLAGFAMEVLQRFALAADFALVIFALIHALGDRPSDLPGASGGRTAAILRAGRYAGIIWLIGLLPSDVVRMTWPIVAALLAIWLYEGWFVGAQARTIAARPWYRPLFIKEDLDMQGRLLIAAIFLGLTAFPALGRGLDLSGENLVARAPTETMMAALVVAQKSDAEGLAKARQNAWVHYGRGINLDKWRFERAKFDRAEMAHIRLRDAKLNSASLEYSNLIRADLIGANLSGASLRYSDMQEAVASSLANTEPAKLQIAQASGEPKPASAEAKPVDDPCKGVTLRDRTDLSKADFSGANLTGADLRCSILRGIKMDSKTILTGARLDGANLCAANLASVDLSGVVGATTAIFAHSDVRWAILPDDLSWSQLQQAIIRGMKHKSGSGPDPKWNKANAMGMMQDPPKEEVNRLLKCDEPNDPGNIPR